MSEPTAAAVHATHSGGPRARVGRSGAALPAQDRHIVVRGHGEVEVAPDALRLELAVEADAASVSTALGRARTTMAALRTAVADAGVAREDLRTSGLNVWQRYTDAADAQVSYLAGESLTVLLRDPDSVDAVLQAASGAAADRLRVQGLMFVVVDSTDAEDQARQLALADAQRVAGVYVSALGRELGTVVHLAEGGPTEVASFGRRAAKSAELSVGVERGTQTITADVTVEWTFA